MTLHTRVAIVGPISKDDAFKLALTAICVSADEADRIATAEVAEPWTRDDGTLDLSTRIGQGLPGIVECIYRPDGPLYAEDHYEEWDGDRWFDTPACGVQIGWDTTYGFTGPNGMGCADLHARSIVAVHQEITQRGMSMHWYNEYAGKWHPGIDNLDTLSAAGLEADLWFRNTALPAVSAHLAGGCAMSLESRRERADHAAAYTDDAKRLGPSSLILRYARVLCLLETVWESRRKWQAVAADLQARVAELEEDYAHLRNAQLDGGAQ